MRQLLVGLPLLVLAIAVAWRPAGSVHAVPLPDAAPMGAVSPLSAAELADAAAIIDRLVDADLASAKQKPNPRTTDEQFLRRAYLALVGRIPTVDEAQAFLGSSVGGKRDVLIDRLLASEGHVLHAYTFWADLLRVQTRLGDRYPGQNYIAWLKQSLRDNKPYDQLVRELVTAQGALLEKGNGATGFYIRDAGMPLDHMATVAQVFLGTQIGCAQCHDHPFDTWTRKQFYEFAAYTHGADLQKELPGGKELRQRMKAAKDGEIPLEVKKVIQNLSNSVAVRVKGTMTSSLPLPADYQYVDAKPGTPVAATAIFGSAAPVAARHDPRPVFATWLTSPENPRFATVIANRLWKRAFGLGLIEPVDAITDETVASNPALMEFLTRVMVSVKFDLRRFEQVLCTTQAWQRQATVADLVPGEAYHVAGPLVRRLSAEQVWDSLLTLYIADLDSLTGEDGSVQVAFYESVKDKTADELLAMAVALVDARQQAQQLQEQAKALKPKLAAAKGEELRTLRAKQRELEEQRQDLLAKADINRYGATVKKGDGKKGGGRNGQLLRAAELPSPAPQGHFLRTFGQSDREVIDNASANAAVTQALTLLNGPIDGYLLKNDGVLAATLARATDHASRVRVVYLSILSRHPTPSELALGTAYLARYVDGGVQDLAWSLINGREFLFSP